MIEFTTDKETLSDLNHAAEYGVGKLSSHHRAALKLQVLIARAPVGGLFYGAEMWDCIDGSFNIRLADGTKLNVQVEADGF